MLLHGECLASGWKVARENAATQYAKDHDEAVTWCFANLRVHDLKHTFGKRLRTAGNPEGITRAP